MRYGFIGLGQLGSALAASLLRNRFEVIVFDLNEDSMRILESKGARCAQTLADCAAHADAVISCLPSPQATEEVIGQLKAHFTPNACWIEMGTNDPERVKALAQNLASLGVRVLEAPVTGGVHLAKRGEITILAGGDEALFLLHKPAFQAMGGRIFHIGELGSASSLKIITNMLAFIHLIAAGEALMLAKLSGLDLAQAFHAIKASSGNSFVHETEGALILNGSYNIGFTMQLACKDLNFARQLARKAGMPLEFGEKTAQLFEKAQQRYGPDAWSPKIVQMLEEAMNTHLRAEGFPETIE